MCGINNFKIEQKSVSLISNPVMEKQQALINNGEITMDNLPTLDIHSRLISKLKIQRWLSLLTIPLAWGLLSILADTNIPEFLIILASVTGSVCLWIVIQLLTCIFFLRPRVKNQKPICFQQYPVSSVWPIAKRIAIKLGIFCGPSLFLIIVVCTKQDSGSFNFSLHLDDLIPLIILWAVSCSSTILVVDAISHSLLGKTLNFKLSGASSRLSQTNFHKKHSHPVHNDHSFRKDWYNDVTNPASPVHQATYRRPNDY